LREALIKTCQGEVTKWPLHLPAAVFADRVTVNRSTGFSPFQLLHATLPVLPFDLTEATFLVEGYHKGLSTAELLALRIRQLMKHQEDLDRATGILKKSRFRSKAQFERRFEAKLCKEDFDEGELVLVRNSRIEMELNRKSKPRYLGPYEVERRNTGGAYELKELDGTRINYRFAANRLYPYIHRQHWFMRTHQTEDSESDKSETDSDSSTEASDSSD
ncbi:hypothetical protein FISHEDRAFT_30873, partial [Fistulina hepatica ATCC 64428]